MGRNLAMDLASSELELSAQIAYHLRANHYPPLPLSMVEPCIAAINAANAGDWYEPIELPEPILWRGESSAPTHAIIQAHHLESWLEGDAE